MPQLLTCLQRQSSSSTASRDPVGTPGPLQREVVSDPGHPLDPGTRALMQRKLGHDFGRVRVHADERAAASARSVNAWAYTVGEDIVFDAGRFNPATPAGKRLLAHELAHTVQQSRPEPAGQLGPPVAVSTLEQEADVAAAAALRDESFRPSHHSPPRLARQAPTATPAPAAPGTATGPQAMTRVEFDRIMKTKYGVKTIRTGTFQEQSFGGMNEADWKAWDPGASSPVYTLIVDAFAAFETVFGGLPPVDEIVFYDAEYHRGEQDTAIRSTDIPASYALGRMTLYRALETSNRMFDVQRALKEPTPEQAVKRNITHELGHGIAEIALSQGTDKPPGADEALFKDYRRAVGWSDEGKLYDIQEPAVQQAFANNTTPPSEFQITTRNATSKPWKERPLTWYMAANPGDDFAEAVMAYVNEPEVLKALSPARYEFLDQRKSRWLSSGQPKMNIWERAKRGSPRTLTPSRKPTIWERAAEAK